MPPHNLTTFTSFESEVRSYCRSFPKVFVRSKYSFVFDKDGDQHIDFLAGAGALNYGHNNTKIKQAVIDYINNDGIMFCLDMHTEAKEEFIKSFQRLVLKPRNLDYKLQFTSPTGTSVVESAIKLARKVTGRNNIVCFTNAFHGMTATSLALTGSSHHRQDYMASNVTRFPFDGYFGKDFDSIEYLQKLLKDESSGIDLPAAIILEPVQGEGGVRVASDQWLQKLRQLCTELGILLIVDDIQAGCGRCGKFFSFETSGIKPDLICLSKSIGGIGYPFAVLLINPKLDVWQAGEDNGTFRGNCLAFVASKAMLENYWSDQTLENQIASKEKLVESSLLELKSNYPGVVKDVRGKGLMQGIELFDCKLTSEIVKVCFEHKLLIETCGPKGEVLKLMPALTIDDLVLEDGLSIIKEAFKVVVSQVSHTRETGEQLEQLSTAK